MNCKRAMRVFAFVGVSVSVGSLLWMGEVAFSETANRIVAVVNDDVITQGDVRLRLEAILDGGELPEPTELEVVEIHSMVLQRIIEERLILQEAKHLGVTVGSDEVLRRLGHMRAQHGSEEEFQRWLSASQISVERLKEMLRESIMVERAIQQKVRLSITVSPQEVAKARRKNPSLGNPVDRIRALHILIRVSARRSEDEARKTITHLHRRLMEGADFAELARQYSEDSYAIQGGLMDFVSEGELMPELNSALFQLKKGELSEPIQSRLGFHILRVVEQQAGSKLSEQEISRSVHQQLYQEKFQQAFEKWLKDLKVRAYIEIFDE